MPRIGDCPRVLAQVVEDWRTPDDAVADLVPVPWEDDEVCPEGALEDLAPDEEYFTEATGNEGGSFERTYRRAAIVVWPENRRLALVAQAGVAFALPLLTSLPDDEARTLAAIVVDMWPEDLARAREGSDLRGKLLVALARLGEVRLAARFFDVVVLEDGYNGAENEGIAACWDRLDRGEMAPRVRALLVEHMEEHTGGCADLLGRVIVAGSVDADVRALGETAVATRTSTS